MENDARAAQAELEARACADAARLQEVADRRAAEVADAEREAREGAEALREWQLRADREHSETMEAMRAAHTRALQDVQQRQEEQQREAEQRRGESERVAREAEERQREAALEKMEQQQQELADREVSTDTRTRGHTVPVLAATVSHRFSLKTTTRPNGARLRVSPVCSH